MSDLEAQALVAMVADYGAARTAHALADTLRMMAGNAETPAEAAEFTRQADHIGRAARACESDSPS